MSGYGNASDGVRNFTAGLISVLKNAIFVIGAVAMVLIDIGLGQSFYGIVLGQENLAQVPYGWVMPWAITIAATAVQIAVWNWVVLGGKMQGTTLGQKLAIGAAVVVTVGDTLADLGAITGFIYGPKYALNILPPEWNLGVLTLFVVIGIIAGANELLLGYFLGSKRSTPASHAMA